MSYPPNTCGIDSLNRLPPPHQISGGSTTSVMNAFHNPPRNIADRIDRSTRPMVEGRSGILSNCERAIWRSLRLHKVNTVAKPVYCTVPSRPYEYVS